MPKLSITNLTTGPFVLQDPSGVTLFSISVDPGATVVKTVTSDMVQNIESYLVAAAASKQIVYSLQDDATSTADRVPPNVRVVLATPDYMATTDDVLITKLTVAGRGENDADVRRNAIGSGSGIVLQAVHDLLGRSRSDQIRLNVLHHIGGDSLHHGGARIHRNAEERNARRVLKNKRPSGQVRDRELRH
jgi:hypothetical protein